jgi:lipopolysaccharide transport system ATP-binding protein
MIDSLRFEKDNDEDFWAIQEVSFNVQPGDSIGIIGRNGAGKSTLLKILSKITPPTIGRIVTRGRIASLLEVGTGFHPELTGRENIFFNGSLLGMKRKEIQVKFDEIVDFSGTEKFLDTALKHYSSGMQLRLAFSVASLLEPEILVIDEVLAVGDAEFQRKCLGKMEEVSNSGRTILFVSHNMAAVNQLCKQAILLDKGKVISQGTSREVIDVYTSLEDTQMQLTQQKSKIHEKISISDLKLIQADLSALQDILFSFTLESEEENTISGLALLVYNDLNERIGIVDLRSSELYTQSSKKKTIQVEGKIVKAPLLEGTYYVGLFISSNLFHGDSYKLAKLQILAVARKVLPYELKYRGYVEFDIEFKIK